NVSTFNVARSTSSTGDNYASYVKFNLAGQDRSAISRAILSVTGHNAANANVDTIEVYGIVKDNWSPATLTWSTAPDLSAAPPRPSRSDSRRSRCPGAPARAACGTERAWRTSILPRPDSPLRHVPKDSRRIDDVRHAQPPRLHGGRTRRGDAKRAGQLQRLEM